MNRILTDNTITSGCPYGGCLYDAFEGSIGYLQLFSALLPTLEFGMEWGRYE